MTEFLKPIGRWLHGELIANGSVTTEELNTYIDEFVKNTDETYETGNVTKGYSYYFDQLKSFAEIYPDFDYHRTLTEKRTKTLSMFYTLVRLENKPKKSRYY